MAGPGGGPPRRSHTKSRKGCKTCKRRHIRCDESFPQCRNCTKHSCRCDYMDAPSQSDERPKSPQGANLLWTPAVERDIEIWRQTGNFPFPEMHLYREPVSADLSLTDLRLIHHVCSVSIQMQLEDSSKFTIWTQKIPMFVSIASSYSFVMHSLLSFSATHLAWMTKCPVTNSVGYHHRGIALKGLQEAIGNFSRENSDAVLAASILLSWQATDWRGWASLMQGTSTVIDAMQSWKHESNFADFMDEQATFPTAQPTSTIRLETLGRREPRREDLATLQHIFTSIQRVGACLTGREEESHLNELMSFIRSLRSSLPVRTPAEQFQLLHPLRSWLFWLPISYSQRVNRDPLVMVLLAHFYAVALAVEPLFPAVGSAYFGSLSVAPIEEIYKNLATLEVEESLDDNITIPVGLMEFPLEMVAAFRSRMGYVSQSSRPYAPIERSPYDMGSLELDAEGDFVGYEGPYGQDSNNLTPSTPHSASSSTAQRPQILETHLCNSIDQFDVTAFAAYPLPRSPACFVTEDGSIYNSPAMDFGAGVPKDSVPPVSASWTLKSQTVYPKSPHRSDL